MKRTRPNQPRPEKIRPSRNVKKKQILVVFWNDFGVESKSKLVQRQKWPSVTVEFHVKKCLKPSLSALRKRDKGKGGKMKQRLTWNSGKPYVQSYRPLSILWHTLLATIHAKCCFISPPFLCSWSMYIEWSFCGMIMPPRSYTAAFTKCFLLEKISNCSTIHLISLTGPPVISFLFCKLKEKLSARTFMKERHSDFFVLYAEANLNCTEKILASRSFKYSNNVQFSTLHLCPYIRSRIVKSLIHIAQRTSK